MTSLKQPHFHEDYHRPRANDRSTPTPKKKLGADKATDVTDGRIFHIRTSRAAVTTLRVTQRCSIHKWKKKKREKESERPATIRRFPIKKPEIQARQGQWQLDEANYIRSRRIEFSETTCGDRARPYFPRARFRRRLQGAVATPARRRGESSVCDRERPREHWNQPTPPPPSPPPSTHLYPPVHPPPPTLPPSTMPHPLSSDAVASTTISSSLPPLLPPCHRHRCSANPPILYPSTAIHRHHQYHHLQFPCRWRGSLPPPVFDAATTPPRLPARQVDTDDRRYYQTPSFPSSLSTFELRHPLYKFPSLLHLSSACASRCIRG